MNYFDELLPADQMEYLFYCLEEGFFQYEAHTEAWNYAVKQMSPLFGEDINFQPNEQYLKLANSDLVNATLWQPMPLNPFVFSTNGGYTFNFINETKSIIFNPHFMDLSKFPNHSLTYFSRNTNFKFINRNKTSQTSITTTTNSLVLRQDDATYAWHLINKRSYNSDNKQNNPIPMVIFEYDFVQKASNSDGFDIFTIQDYPINLNGTTVSQINPQFKPRPFIAVNRPSSERETYQIDI